MYACMYVCMYVCTYVCMYESDEFFSVKIFRGNWVQNEISIERFHMTSQRPYWCIKSILWELNSFLM